MGALIPLLGAVIPPLIQLAEDKLGAKKGPQKNGMVVNMASVALKALRDEGMFEGPEGAREVAELVESVFQVMKHLGQLREVKDGQAVPPAAGQRVVFEGVMRQV